MKQKVKKSLRQELTSFNRIFIVWLLSSFVIVVVVVVILIIVMLRSRSNDINIFCCTNNSAIGILGTASLIMTHDFRHKSAADKLVLPW